jgi:hypothetical protein
VRTRFLTWAILTSAAAVVLLLPAGSAASTPSAHAVNRPPSKCVTDGVTSRSGRSIFPELRTLGVRTWSGALSWAQVAPQQPTDPTSPNDPAYRWPKTLKRSLDQARAHGIEPVLNVTGFPGWSNGGRPSQWAPTRAQDYADFVTAAVREYPQVRRWMVISEPGNGLNFQPQGGHGRTAPRRYAEILAATYRAVHAARPGAKVISGGLQPAGLNDGTGTAADTFLANMILPNGRRPPLDLFGINPYTERRLDLSLGHRPFRIDFDDLDWLGHRLDQLWPGRHLKLFIDEFGWNTEHEALGWLYYVPRKKQATNLARAYALAAKFGRVDTLCSYLLYDTPPLRDNTQWLNWTSGLRTRTGVRKPAWWAFRRIPVGPRHR